MPFKFKSDKELVSFVIGAKLPEWQRKLFLQFAESVQVHSQGEVFYKLDRLFPNEHPESKMHRLLSFESITEPSFGRAANNINRIFKNSSYTVEASDKTIELSTEHSYKGQNFYNWFLDQWVKMALKTDPNARIVLYPQSYVDEGNPFCVFVESCFLKHLSEDAVVFVSERESDVDYELQTMHVCSELFYDQTINRVNLKQSENRTYTPKVEATVRRYVYHAFFKGDGFYRIEQSKKEGSEYEITYYPIPYDELPIMDAGGEKGKRSVNKSFLQPFVPFGNLALLQHSQHTAVNFTFSFPRMSEIQTNCPACQSGKVACETEADKQRHGEFKDCALCKGTGKTANQTPYKVYVKNYDPNGTSGSDGTDKYLEVDDVKFYTPSTGILDYSKSEWRDYLEMAEIAVYIQQRIKTGNVESAKSKEIDRDDLYSFLARVGQTYYQRLRFCMQWMENYNVSNPTQVNINAPYSYAILSEAEAFTALKEMLTSTVPVMLKGSQVEGFVNKFVSQSSPVRKFMDVLKLTDPLLFYNGQEIAGFKASNIVTADQYATHVFSYPVLQMMYSQDKNIFLEDTDKIVAKLKEELKPYMPKVEDDLKTKFVNQLSQQQPTPPAPGNNDVSEEDDSQDNIIPIERVPLAIQQLSLAFQRAIDTNNTELANKLKERMNKLLARI